MVRLHYDPGTISLAPHIVLNELKLSFEPVRVAIADNSLHNYKTPEFIRVSPAGLVPVLEVEGEVLTESMAISLYLVRRERNMMLLPAAGTLAEARVLEWIAWLATGVHRSIGAYFRPEHLAEDDGTRQRLREFARTHMAYHAQRIEEGIASVGRYATGADFTLVDAFLLVYYRWFQLIGLDMMRWPRWRKVTRNSLEREAVCVTLSTEEITFAV
ncbi:glutathione S-transferase N-terminal domain-containing protein [Xanthomonas hortorum pv. vitians]|uniref:glutathione S-transferase family protein n=1 Tax=Xanthomonas TaxID=338 RepID=UPI001652D07B|nr:glutathione S-transferase N-terminal domain-containing protein [Xanthomonas hortorum]MDA4138660.1 glutathione S-transferase N-terminal domain-containing protein [Xanthomonas hortorum pv. vitians]QNM60354.1 Glutathione S-transferase [Xanthomonas hortorum pv. vitians]CAD7381945.1 glutathione S-transferase N-terminal domain-containing protein [Xanthomonas arboricola]